MENKFITFVPIKHKKKFFMYRFIHFPKPHVSFVQLTHLY